MVIGGPTHISGIKVRSPCTVSLRILPGNPIQCQRRWHFYISLANPTFLRHHFFHNALRIVSSEIMHFLSIYTDQCMPQRSLHNQQTHISHSSGSWKSKTKLVADWVATGCSQSLSLMSVCEEQTSSLLLFQRTLNISWVKLPPSTLITTQRFQFQIHHTGS